MGEDNNIVLDRRLTVFIIVSLSWYIAKFFI